MQLKEVLKKGDLKTKIILFSIPLILSAYIYYGMPERFVQIFSPLTSRPFFDFYSHIYQFLSVFILFFLLPCIIIKFLFKGNLKDYGLSWGDKKYGLKFVFIVIPLIALPVIYLSSKMPEFQAEYPLAKSIIHFSNYLIIYELFYVFYYIGWEFFFRGYILFGLREKFGDIYAILIQTIPSVLLHIGKPLNETIGAIVVGIGFGYLALRTRSIFWPLLIHLFCGVALDIFIIIQVSPLVR